MIPNLKYDIEKLEKIKTRIKKGEFQKLKLQNKGKFSLRNLLQESDNERLPLVNVQMKDVSYNTMKVQNIIREVPNSKNYIWGERHRELVSMISFSRVPVIEGESSMMITNYELYFKGKFVDSLTWELDFEYKYNLYSNAYIMELDKNNISIKDIGRSSN